MGGGGVAARSIRGGPGRVDDREASSRLSCSWRILPFVAAGFYLLLISLLF